MICSYLSLAICLFIATKLMFFMEAHRVHAPLCYNICALIVTIYAGDRSIQHLATLNLPTSVVELTFEFFLLIAVMTLSTRLHRQIQTKWRRQ